MDKLTKKVYIDNLKNSITFRKLGNITGNNRTPEMIKNLIIDKNLQFKDIAQNFECKLYSEKSTFIETYCNGDIVREEMSRSEFFRFYHNDICYLLHCYKNDIGEIWTTSIKGIKI